MAYYWHWPKSLIDYWDGGFLSIDECYPELYHHKVILKLDDYTISSLREMEKWCEEHFGELDEYSKTSQWQVAKDQQRKKNGLLWTMIIIFLFYKEEDAMAFKLRWIE